MPVRRIKDQTSIWKCAKCGHLTEGLPPQWEHLQKAHGYTFTEIVQARGQGEHMGEGYTWRINGVLVVERDLESKMKREKVLRC